MRLIIFHLYTDLINRLRPPAAEACCRERRSAQQTTTHIGGVRHPRGPPLLGSHAASPPLHQRMDACTVHAHRQTRAILIHGSRLSDETEDGLQSRCVGDAREPRPKRPEWSSHQAIMRLFFLLKTRAQSDPMRWAGGAECTSAEGAEGIPPCENITRLDSDKWFRSWLSAGQRLFHWR